MDEIFNEEFWRHPFWMKLKDLIDKESQREKTLVVDPERLSAVAKTKKLLEEIASEECMEYRFETEIDRLFRCLSLNVLSYTFSFGKTAREKFSKVISLCDSMGIDYKTNGQIQLQFDFNNALKEIESDG